MFNSTNPKLGSLILSEPFMIDPNFERAVILLSEYTDKSCVGFILNQPSKIVISDVISSITNDNHFLFMGGPVENDVLFFVHKVNHLLPNGMHIKDDIYWGGNFDILIELINKNKIQPNEIKFFLGYAGWTNKQLNEEINQNSWAVHNKYDNDLIFLNDGEDLWKQALIDLGPKYAHVAQFPKLPFLN